MRANTGSALNCVGTISDGAGTVMVQYQWVGIAVRLNQIFHPQVTSGLEMNDGSQALHYSGLDRYYRHSRMQWQKNDGSVNFEQQFNTYDRMGNLLGSDSNGSLNGVNGGGASNWDQTYTYDGLNRLTGYKPPNSIRDDIERAGDPQRPLTDVAGCHRARTQVHP